MDKHFTHLHLHTEYSLLDGAISLKKLVRFGKEQHFKALAITDHGNIFGAVKFFQQCKKENIKPIIGIETYLTNDVRIKDVNKKYYHLILLVQNEIGYENLCKLIAFSFKEGFYFKPRIDYRILQEHNKGLIATSGCLGGHLRTLIQTETQEIVDKNIDWFLKHFDENRFYLEIQPEDQEDQKIYNQQLYDLSQRRGIPLVATGDCHYPTIDDRTAHEVMLSIQTHAQLNDEDRFTFGDCRTYMRTTEEMLYAFKGHEDAVWNSGHIADMCNFSFKTGVFHFPAFLVPDELSPEKYFTKLCQKGFDRLIKTGEIPQEKEIFYQERLDEEMALITTMGYVEYFLVVSDFVLWAKEQKIPVGPGRGSVAGSLVSWALSITNIDPIKYTLLFERFLNPERITMPDIDIDFCIEGRELVIEYVRKKYGNENVCQIITFGTMMAKGVVKDVARVLGIPFEDANALTNLIPNQLNITLKEAKEQEPKLVEMIENNPRIAELFSIAGRLEGLTRHASKHAAGVVISPRTLESVLPLYIPPKSDELVTQYAMTELEYLGYLKMDFLGLKTLTLINQTVKRIQKDYDVVIDIDRLSLNDEKTFILISEGKTSGVFQFESNGLKEVLRKLEPSKFEDIIAVNALYRPGPLGSGMVDDFIERRHGRQKATYLLPELEEILKETYGIIVYQEQVMKIASAVAGYSLGEADILRRAMGKKKADVMAKQEEIFLNRSQERNVDVKKAKELFDLMAYFAGYGFNKSHSAAYAIITYQTAYLKAHYPAEFMATLISLEAANADKMVFYLEEAKAMNLTISPPNINQSRVAFSVHNNKLLFGLQGIKNVGTAALHTIIEERRKKLFKDMLDFCMRVDLRTVNKRVIEHLIYAGAFDKLPGHRAQKFQELSLIMNQAIEQKRALATGQMSMFEAQKNSTSPTSSSYTFQPCEKWSDQEMLEKEQSVMGFYVSAHPLDTYQSYFKIFSPTSFDQALEIGKTSNKQEPSVVCCGIMKSQRTITTKKGDPMCFARLEDYKTSAEIVVFPSVYKKVSQWFDTYQVFVVKGTIDIGQTSICKILATKMVPLELVFQEWKSLQHVTLHIPTTPSLEIYTEIKKRLPSGTTALKIAFQENGKQLCLNTTTRIALDMNIIKQLNQQNVSVKISL